MLITASLVVLRLSLYSSQPPWWYSDYSFTHHSLPDGTKTTPILNTVSVVVLRLSQYTTQSHLCYSDYPNTHHSLSDGTQTIPILITIYLVAQTIPILITVSLVVLRESLYASQSLWWHLYIRPSHFSSQSPRLYLDYPYTHYSLPGGTQTIPMNITVSLVVPRLPLH